MIEPYVSERQCCRCRKFKPETDFLFRSDRKGQRRSVCTECRKERAKVYNTTRRRDVQKPRKDPGPPPGPEVPMPSMSLQEQLDCVRFRKWRGPVDYSRPLRAVIGGGYV